MPICETVISWAGMAATPVFMTSMAGEDIWGTPLYGATVPVIFTMSPTLYLA